MYSNIPGVQILISLLKQYNIKHIVASPGSRNAALVHSLENDNFFKLYSFVDERSAAYFALGLSEKLDIPVCVSCTSATATCNYMPAIQEAFERNIQLIALTADRNPRVKFNMDDQNINQTNMYDGFVNYAVDVPNIKNSEQQWYFNRCVNEALLHLNNNGKKGPIQINFEMNYSLEELSTFPCKEIKKYRKIDKYEDNIKWKEIANKLMDKKVLVFCASNFYRDSLLKKQILKFKELTNAVVIGDYYSNMIDDNILNASIISNFYGNKDVEMLKPDIIILLGDVIYMPLKVNTSLFVTGVETWQISEDLRLNDGFRNLKKIFKTKELTFFENLNKNLEKSDKNSNYFDTWKNILDLVKFPNLEFTHMNAIQKLITSLPNNVLIHTSVLDAIRITNYFKLPKEVKCFGNIGADGIDGALSTFLGQASKNKNELSFLIIGDLSLMYDMNALYMDIPNNVRIMVINNYAGSEFHRNFGIERIPTLNEYIAAGHMTLMKDVTSISKIKYLCATNEEELDKNIKIFVKKSERPILLEVITDAEKDAKKLTEFWNLNKPNFSTKKGKIKDLVKKILSPRMKNFIKSIIKK